jgi:large subunit ribosomal protein L5
LGIKESNYIPEINVDKVNKSSWYGYNFVTTAKSDKEAFELLTAFGMRSEKRKNN